ncbi:MAG: hypothetical protein KC503_08015 [Myxococcales bacterium]|nr:hypothetical protein [Myxococcales bacterium]
MSLFAASLQSPSLKGPAALLLSLSLLSMPAAARAAPPQRGARVGKRMPWFELPNLKNGRKVGLAQLRGHTTMLVVGRSKRAAPRCRAWGVALHRRFRSWLEVYQVAVIDKPWYMPRALVLRKVRTFSPAGLHHRVLLEWYTVFADSAAIARHDDPVLLLVGPDLIVRWRYRGQLDAAALARAHRVLAAYAPKRN